MEAFLAKFKLFAADSAWTDRRKSICLAQSLEGPASEVLLDLMSEERLNNTTLIEALKRRFGDRQSYLALQNQLQLCRRAPGEKLGALAADIARLVPPALCPHARLAGHLILDEALNYDMAAERVLQDSDPLQPVRVS
ncbi:hypothetical protein EOD39_8818 [Acipenser ruthenus]|uniref:Uncharacterized protein n=1 Tax=Acipenser ruthenus TaxID=7906 RepID=A0A444U2I3_ACIRT|nr:hypothetical protein EOD39_8818 [Acipenser ruthenus]